MLGDDGERVDGQWVSGCRGTVVGGVMVLRTSVWFVFLVSFSFRLFWFGWLAAPVQRQGKRHPSFTCWDG